MSKTRMPPRVGRRIGTLSLIGALAAAAGVCAPSAHADNKRLNYAVLSNVYTTQRMAGCTGELHSNPQLQLAAQWHTDDLLANRELSDDTGSDGSTAVDRAKAAGYVGDVAETVAINPAVAISSLELIQRWYADPIALATMRDCRYTTIGVWSENSLDRTVVVAVYGHPR